MSVAFAEESGQQGMYSFSSLYNAYLECRRRKRNTINALHFEHDLLENLLALGETLRAGTYQPTRSVCFVTMLPKLREIFAADFRDRIVHHLLVPRLEQVFEPKFIHDSYACRVGRGTHAAAERLGSFMRSVSQGGRTAAWFLQLDIRNFFMTIDKDILLEMIQRRVKDPVVLDLTQRIIMHDCTGNYVYKGVPTLHAKVPKHKTLFHAPKGKGLPIGNLTSQFFANVYLNELDQFVKHTLKAKYYLRYVDDFIILDPSRGKLVALKQEIEAFLTERLQLTLKDGCTLKRVSEGSDFLGYIVRPWYVLARNRVVGNLAHKLDVFEQRIVSHKGARSESVFSLSSPDVNKPGYFSRHLISRETALELRQTLASYLGHFRHANTRRLVRGIFARYEFLPEMFEIETRKNEYHLKLLTEPITSPDTFREQYEWFMKIFSAHCIFFQVGRYFELHGSQMKRHAGILGLKAGHQQRGFGAQCGFPKMLLDGYKNICIRKGIDYVVVMENGYYPTGLKKRVVVETGCHRRPKAA